jgi:ubiquinone/menaquinone biosynthesis C-methylase UbiE
MTTSTTTTKPLTAEELFDSVGPGYEAAFEGLKGQAAAIQWLISQLSAKKPAKIIDIGCGTGRPVCSSLADAGHDVLGIDISANMLEAARKNVPNAKFAKADIKSFVQDAESLDAVAVFFSLIAEVSQDDIRKTLKNIYEWLKPGGLFIMGTVRSSVNLTELKWMGRSAIASSFSSEEYLDYLKEIGFTIEFKEESEFTPKAVEAGICEKAEDVWEEPHLFVYARK